MFKKIGKLEIIVFVAGTVVMILELIGSRILAPYLGTSIFVWASLIGIILAALSLGYYAGGKFSVNNPNLKFLSGILFIAGLIIIFIPITKEAVLDLAMKLGIKFGSITATVILFALPSILLGIVSPYAIRLKTKDIERVGGTAGNLYAISTIGSIFGTFIAGFYLIPNFNSIQILGGLSFVLILTSLLSNISKGKIFSLILIFILSAILLTLPSYYLLETDSAYNHIRVVNLPDPETNLPLRALLLATEVHSVIYLNSEKLFSKYHQLYQLDNLFTPEIKKALTLGGGAYIAPMNFLKRYPQAEMTVVEIDPAVTAVAREYFGLKDNSRLKIYHQDGRIFLNTANQKYDVIYGDAFASYFSIPFQLTTKQALEKTSNLLTDEGILVLNIISSLGGKKSLFFQAEYKTLKEVFPQIYIFPTRFYQNERLDEAQNIIVIATKNPQLLTKKQLLEKASSEQKPLLNHLYTKEIFIEPKIKILTDDFAPVDYYISKIL